MAIWGFPGGNQRLVSEESLDFIAKEEKAVRAALIRAMQMRSQLLANPPPYFNGFQMALAKEQAEEDISYFTMLLSHIEKKLQWERDKRWKQK